MDIATLEKANEIKKQMMQIQLDIDKLKQGSCLVLSSASTPQHEGSSSKMRTLTEDKPFQDQLRPWVKCYLESRLLQLEEEFKKL